MTTCCYTNVTDGGRVIVNVIEDDKQQRTEFVTYYDMNEISIPKDRFQLTDKQNNQFEQILNSQYGQQILNRLKNAKTERLVNVFLSYYKKRIKKSSKMEAFIEEIISEPLAGKNSLSFATVGITKEQIWNAFVENKLIIL